HAHQLKKTSYTQKQKIPQTSKGITYLHKIIDGADLIFDNYIYYYYGYNYSYKKHISWKEFQ
uniref:hypothetical protein n=1 Tax=Bacillus sp. 95MFCvi2.1 TaxID=1151121 RepID=UPI001E2CF68F